jgi:lipopolysaccharide transport system permease protein
VLLFFEGIVFRQIPITALCLPLIWTPLILGSLALSWLLATLGVFLRDIGQVVGVLVSILMFLSPVFFPLSATPNGLRWVLEINPLAIIIEQTRQVLILNIAPRLDSLILEVGISLVACEVCYRVFKRMKPAFADVI